MNRTLSSGQRVCCCDFDGDGQTGADVSDTTGEQKDFIRRGDLSPQAGKEAKGKENLGDQMRAALRGRDEALTVDLRRRWVEAVHSKAFEVNSGRFEVWFDFPVDQEADDLPSDQAIESFSRIMVRDLRLVPGAEVYHQKSHHTGNIIRHHFWFPIAKLQGADHLD